VVIVPVEGYYKVQITGFTRPEEREELIPILNILGFTDLTLSPVNKPLVPPPIVLRKYRLRSHY